jgi:hypothetical protein
VPQSCVTPEEEDLGRTAATPERHGPTYNSILVLSHCMFTNVPLVSILVLSRRSDRPRCGAPQQGLALSQFHVSVCGGVGGMGDHFV